MISCASLVPSQSPKNLLDCIIKSVGNIPLYSSPMRPHLEHWVHFWAFTCTRQTGHIGKSLAKVCKDDKGEAMRAGMVQPGEEMARGILENYIKIWWEDKKEIEPCCLQWCLVTGQEAMGRDWNRGHSI